jgi:UDP-glucose 4-epimerase
MRVVVTGGAGYIGSHVVRDLIQAGYEPIIIDDLSKGHKPSIPEGICFHSFDIKDTDKVYETFNKYRPQAVMHFAGSTEVGESVKKPGQYFRNNILSGINLLDAMAEFKVESIVFSSTAAVYGEPEQTPITEEHPKVPTNPYGESKLFFEHILARYKTAYGIRSTCLRYFNAAGAHHSEEIGEDHNPESHLIPIILQTALGLRDEVAIFGTDYPTADGTCIRDYIHVEDLSSAHILALKALLEGAMGSVYNLGNGQGFSVREVINTAQEVVGKSIPHKVAGRRIGDPAVLVASSDKIKRELDWKPKYSDLKIIIETAWNWHKNHPRGYENNR